MSYTGDDERVAFVLLRHQGVEAWDALRRLVRESWASAKEYASDDHHAGYGYDDNVSYYRYVFGDITGDTNGRRGTEDEFLEWLYEFEKEIPDLVRLGDSYGQVYERRVLEAALAAK